ncbi:MAG: type II secretion system protein [bacterium]|nr:type II secretion system protein [bacterium]
MKHFKEDFSRGFTMIELLVVIAIIGILAAVMVPFIGNLFSKGDEAEAREDLRRLGQAALAYKTGHEGHYPAAGGYIYSFPVQGCGGREDHYGRALGWVNFQHDCDSVKEGMVANSYDGGTDASKGEQCQYIREYEGCGCFREDQADCGLDLQPAGWKDTDAESGVTLVHGTIYSGALYKLLNQSLDPYVNANFARVAVEKKLASSEDDVIRAYAMNVITGTSEEVYDTGLFAYDAQGKGRHGYVGPIQWGAKVLYARETGDGDSAETSRAEPNRTVLFVEMDLDEMSGSDELKGDQVWDWDNGDESIGFNFTDGNQKFGYVCFADGRVERINDPSNDASSPDSNKRRKLSKWYGSGGVSADGEKLD